eukprot:TRINITY_DN3361_c0_g1_i1.p1 TRINITY_DN3361_c0_g1~~TRINITY_DN3361_c0_g1_i1.p1  ORF type:complete len:112 (-),score=24.93 TRINITY_DN3361_c0_g1_i1:90-425(-)
MSHNIPQTDSTTPPPERPLKFQPYLGQGDDENSLKGTVWKYPLAAGGLGATVFVLGSGLRAMWGGNSTQSNKFMRARVTFQGLTVAAICAGVAYFTMSTDHDGPQKNHKLE